jgi:hypothetical protein
MPRRLKTFAAILGLVAMVFFISWPIWKWFKFRPVSAAVFERTRAAVEKNPRLQPAWDIAMEDGVLTRAEAMVILRSANERADDLEQ